jgi:serine protease
MTRSDNPIMGGLSALLIVSIAVAAATLGLVGCGEEAIEAMGPLGGSGGAAGADQSGTGGSGGGGGLPPGTLTISGTLFTPAFAFVDGDTLDASNPTHGNNGTTGSDMQLLGNPAAVGGYIGPMGESVDVSDFYRVPLGAGQRVTLFLANRNSDFDLFLYAVGPGGDLTLVDDSQGTGSAEQVVAPDGGEFVAEVYGCGMPDECSSKNGGGGLYNLVAGSSQSLPLSTARSKLSSQSEFVEGELLLPEGSGFQVLKMQLPDGWSQLDRDFDLKRARQTPAFERWTFRSRSPLQRQKSALTSIADPIRPLSPTIAAVKRVRGSGIAAASPNYVRHARATPDDSYYPLQWHYPAIGLPAAWDVTTGSSDVVVAVIDTGVVLQHPDLQNQLVPGYDFISDARAAGDGDGIDPDPSDPGDGSRFEPSSFHGTHVTGTIAARTDNGIGVAGVAWQARVMPVRVLGTGGGTDADICQGMLYAAGLPNASGTVPTQRADILNMSFGGEGFSQCMQDAIDLARAEGVIAVAAAGNDNKNGDNDSPAGLDGVVSVAATDFSNERTFYSNFGASVDVAAPGGDTRADVNADGYPDGVLSTLASDKGDFTYEFYQGTSMAAPHVAGVFALMKALHAELSAQDVDLLLAGDHPGTSMRITRDLGAPGRDDVYGHGLIDALNAVLAAAELSGSPPIERPVLRVEPLTLELTEAQPSASISVRNGGTGTLAVTASTDVGWLSVSPPSGGERTYAVTADADGLSDGLHIAAVSFSSNGGSTSVPVRLIVGPPLGTGGDIGTLYLLLVGSNFGKISISSAATSAAEGYRYTIEGVRPGAYRLFAGTDLNSDTFINDAGEALGAYPTLADPLELEVIESTSGLDFAVGFDSTLQALAGGLDLSSNARAPANAPIPRE